MHFYVIINNHTVVRIEADSINAAITRVLDDYFDGCDLYDNELVIISEEEMITRMERRL